MKMGATVFEKSGMKNVMSFVVGQVAHGLGNFSCRYSEELKLLKTLDFSQRLMRLWRKSRVEILFTNETLMVTSCRNKEMKRTTTMVSLCHSIAFPAPPKAGCDSLFLSFTICLVLCFLCYSVAECL
jgi:hypothetical protein